jgi:hypothetical protein
MDGASRYQVGVLVYDLLSGDRKAFLDPLTGLPDNRLTRYPPEMAGYQITWYLVNRTKKWTVIGAFRYPAGS